MTGQQCILTVDHNPNNLALLSQFLGEAGFETILATSQDEFDQAIESGKEINLALVDITGFNKGIWECCDKLRGRNIPLLIISPKQSFAVQEASYDHSVAGVLIKPLVIKEFIHIIEELLIKRREPYY